MMRNCFLSMNNDDVLGKMSYLHLSLVSTSLIVNKRAWQKSSSISDGEGETDFQPLKLGG